MVLPVLASDSEITYSKGIDPNSLSKIHPKLQDMVHYISGFCQQNRIKFVITSTIRTFNRNKEVGSKSVTHVEGRAVDFSIKEVWGWTPELIMEITRQIERNYTHFGAFSAVGNKQVVIFNHDAGNGFHVHLQVYRGLSWK